jgi:hypothetical protein
MNVMVFRDELSRMAASARSRRRLVGVLGLASLIIGCTSRGGGGEAAAEAPLERAGQRVTSTAEVASRDGGGVDEPADAAAEERADSSPIGDGAESPRDGGVGDAALDASGGDAGEVLAAPDDGLLADWSDRRVTVYRGGEAVVSFPAVFGRRGVGKERRGDEKTPAGRYRLHAGRPSRYDRFLPVSYPNSEDGRRGLGAKLITKAQLRAIEAADAAGRLTPQWTELGGQVGVHGFGGGLTELAKIFRATPTEVDGTRGCIMILDEHVRRLEKLIGPGAKLVIRP